MRKAEFLSSLNTLNGSVDMNLNRLAKIEMQILLLEF